MNPTFTPGGSSGGEAALLSSHGSLVGWGTDIGGSIRIPSHMNGLWGLKPSVSRSANRLVEVTLTVLISERPDAVSRRIRLY
jgi:amidase